jgi:SAM-dependent methyltransferase
VAVVTKSTPYWGEITKEDMQRLIDMSRQQHWRKVVEEHFPDMADNIMNEDRSAFQDVIPLPEGSLIMDVGAGLGGVSANLARRHRVVALEGVWERCAFANVRKEQDRLDSLMVMNCDLNQIPLADGQFDCVLLIGVLEWVALFDLNGPPEEVQRRFLDRLRRLLAPGGMILIGIENRFGWPSWWSGALDHSGLPYTNLMPRWMAHWACSRNATYRSSHNVGYRTYTYSYYGFQNLFRNAGLEIADTWITPNGYQLPSVMVPLQQEAVKGFVEMNWIRPAVNTTQSIKNKMKKMASTEWFWRLFGNDFMFLLKAAGDAPARPR